MHNHSPIDFSPVDLHPRARYLDVTNGTWGILPDLGLTEKYAPWLGQNINRAPEIGPDTMKSSVVSTPPKTPPASAPMSTPTAPMSTQNKANPPPASNELTDLRKIPAGDLNPVQKTRKAELEAEINKAAGSQNDAAAVAAEGRRQAALHSYQGKVAAAGQAKESAKGQYDWIIDTLGSNKKDLLDQVALNEQTGTQTYEKNTADTTANYDKARQEILSTYRDLNLQQEKVLRGTGVGSSSRAQEASLRLNNLMGKDLTDTSKGEADSLALIGNALSAFKSQVVLTKNSIETDTKSKLDKAALDYDTQVKAIDANTQLAANEREDAYAAAESQLASDTANINSWAVGLKLQADQTLSSTKDTLDNFVVDMTDSQGLLGKSIEEKQAATQALVDQISTSVTLDKEGNLVNPAQGVKKSTSSKTLADLYAPEGTTPGMAGAAGTPDQNTTTITQKAKQDPLLASLMA